MANTKLTKSDKNWLKNVFMVHNPNATFYSNGTVTLCVIPEFNNSKMVRVSVSIMSDDENKFRAKVGKYFAASRMLVGEYITISRDFNVLDFMFDVI